MNNRYVGTEYEDKACEYLRDAGYEILDRNFRSHRGEIDIIARESDTYVFVEVKFRYSNDKGYPEEAVTRSKQETIASVARYYIHTHNISEYSPCRFDVIAYYYDGSLKHYVNAFGGM